MKTLSIEKELSLAAIEHHLKELTKSEETKLRLPNKIKYSGGFGTEAALTQLIATWARNQKEPTFHTYVDPNEKQKGFSSLCESFYGMAALALSRKIRRRRELSATPDLSGTVLPLCLIPNLALKSAPLFKSVMPKALACARLPA